ncbi:hypothetical protein GCM10010214_23050 [Streptomyces abikoensis]|nr:hypothetical protein GCM10010214_23050 [Streptomyces abikoensis]
MSRSGLCQATALSFGRLPQSTAAQPAAGGVAALPAPAATAVPPGVTAIVIPAPTSANATSPVRNRPMEDPQPSSAGTPTGPLTGIMPDRFVR